jgi:hypothetical protein
MIKRVRIVNQSGDELILNIHSGVPNDCGLSLFNMTGIGGPNGIVNSTPNTSVGSTVNSARVGERFIEFTLAVDGTVDPETVRMSLYKYFPVTKQIRIYFETGDDREVYIDGVVESNPVNPFAKIENTEVKVKCGYPFFTEVAGRAEVVSTVEPNFTYPFVNNSLTENLLVHGHLDTTPLRTMLYPGSTDTGVILQLHILGPTGNITISNGTTNESMTVNIGVVTAMVGEALSYGDDIYIDTRIGKKSVTAIHNGTSYNVLNAIGMVTTWIRLTPGANRISYVSDNNKNVDLTVHYDVVTEGV